MTEKYIIRETKSGTKFDLKAGCDVANGRSHAEDTFGMNQRKLMDIIDFLPDATLAIDKEGHVIIWNKAIEKMTCIPASEMVGRCDYAYNIPFYGEARPMLMDMIFRDDEKVTTQSLFMIYTGEFFPRNCVLNPEELFCIVI